MPLKLAAAHGRVGALVRVVIDGDRLADGILGDGFRNLAVAEVLADGQYDNTRVLASGDASRIEAELERIRATRAALG